MTEVRNTRVVIGYTNWRGQTDDRRIEPVSLWFGATRWHPEQQWLLRALDVDKQELRDFALADIHSWKGAA